MKRDSNRADQLSLPTEQVELALAHIEQSAAFKSSARHRKLLRHMVARVLDDDLAALKETMLAIEVFDRPAPTALKLSTQASPMPVKWVVVGAEPITSVDVTAAVSIFCPCRAGPIAAAIHAAKRAAREAPACLRYREQGTGWLVPFALSSGS
ncbi:MAG: hypothetical protein Q8K96_18240 [Rubrivivax sp.]|nr:hypothetical protein [Rubrivivax sp.]